jgi:threonine dehydrogenase-like Zn-dependent dehydrogenase
VRARLGRGRRGGGRAPARAPRTRGAARRAQRHRPRPRARAWLAQELRLVASLGYEREDFARVQALLAEGRLAGEALVSGRAPLAELPRVFERLHAAPEEIKVLIDPRA